MAKKKKEHYVPRCYLEKWCIPGSEQVNVFDKEKDEPRINHIEDIASENYFYDLNLEGVFSEEEIIFYDLEGIDLSKIDDEQYIENFFANNIEGQKRFPRTNRQVYKNLKKSIEIYTWENDF